MSHCTTSSIEENEKGNQLKKKQGFFLHSFGTFNMINTTSQVSFGSVKSLVQPCNEMNSVPSPINS